MFISTLCISFTASDRHFSQSYNYVILVSDLLGRVSCIRAGQWRLTLIEHLLCQVLFWVLYVDDLISSPNKPTGWVLLLSPFCRKGS